MTQFAREYGEALFSLAEEEQLLEQIHAEVTELRDCFAKDPKFLTLLELPSISEKERFDVLEEVLGGQVHRYVISFIKILCHRHAMSMFSEIVEYIHGRYNEALGIAEAIVTTAVPLSQENAKRIVGRLEEITGKSIRLTEHVDPAVLGGVRVEVDGRLMDNTLQTRLAKMREHLATDR